MSDTKVTIDDVAESLIAVGDRLEAQFKIHGWQPTQNVHTQLNWMAPALSLNDLKEELQFSAERVRTLKMRRMTAHESSYTFQLKVRADSLNVANVQSGFDAVFGAVLELANAVFRHIPPPPPPPPKVDWEDIKGQRDLLPKDLVKRLRYVEARLQDLEPRSESVGQQIADIEAAHQTAEQLPTDLADLAAQKGDLAKIVNEATRLEVEITAAHTRIEDTLGRVEATETETKAHIVSVNTAADNMIKRSEQALRGATSVGLAKAFDTRSKALSKSGALWVSGLAAALLVALIIGAERVHSLKDVLAGDKSTAVILANVLLALVGIGAPIWFAWLSTKHIGTNFRLAEDYAFKASVSQAYEGYRAEAVEIDVELQKRLFSAALTRLEESPIRLLDTNNHSSPLAELLNNPTIVKSLEQIPGIADKIVALIPSKAGVAAAIVAPVAAAAAITGSVPSSEPEAEH